MKAYDPHAAVSVVWHGDPAVDKEKSDIGDRFLIESLDKPDLWRERLVFKEGKHPTEWVIGIVPPAEMNQAEAMTGASARAWYVFLRSVRDIRGDGGLGKPKKVQRDGVEYVDPEWLAGVMGGHNRRCAIDLGLIAYRWQDLSGDDVKNS